MDQATSDFVLIHGVTAAGKTFRPSDWAERLAGVMSEFHPANKSRARRIGYSPWCTPTTYAGAKAVVVNRQLQAYEPMAWDFVMNFGRDNELRVLPCNADGVPLDAA